MQKFKYINPSLVLAFLFVLQSCAPSIALLKKQKEGAIKVPNEYPEEFIPKNEEGNKTKKHSMIKWKEFFKDENLNQLISQAIQKNQELKILEQEVNIANNEILARRSEYIPKLGFKAGYDSEKVGEFTSQGASDKTTEYEPGKFVPENLHNHTVGMVMSWEIDVWKKLQKATKSSLLKYKSDLYLRRYATTKLVSEIANSYFELMALDNQLLTINKFIAILEQAKELLQLQQQAARVTSLAVKRFDAEVLKNKSLRYKVEQKILITENKLNALIGRYPQKIARDSTKFLELKLQDIDPGVPVDILNNRADIKAAKYALRSAELDVDVMKARFYPSLSIEAQGGYQAFNKSHLYDAPESIFYNLGANLTAPLLNRRAIEADYYTANNLQIQAIYKYEQTMINAYTEVVNQLSMIKNFNTIFDLKRNEVNALTNAIEISSILFKAARVDYVEALLTQRDTLEAQVELIEIKKDVLVSYVNLYKALGGGWKI
jgi:multidrug efflux system outer membrane protein